MVLRQPKIPAADSIRDPQRERKISHISTEVSTGFINQEGTADLAQRISVMWQVEDPDWKVLMMYQKWCGGVETVGRTIL